MDLKFTKETLAKMLTNSVLVEVCPPLGGTTRMTRVYMLPSGGYMSVFERPPTEAALPPLECAAAFSAEPPRGAGTRVPAQQPD